MSSYRRRLMLANQTEENLVLYGNSVQDGTPTPEAPIDIMSIENPIIKVTGKNLINNTLTSQTSNDVEVIVNEDKSITLNGTSSAMSYLTLCKIEGIEGKFFLSGCPTGGGTNTYCLYLYAQREDGTKHYIYDTGNGKNAEMEKGLTYQLKISFNSTFENATFYPMLNKGTEALPYEPYEEELITIDETTPFGKNLIPYPPKTMTSMCTDNGDGTYTINGTGNGTGYTTVYFISGNLGDYLIDGKTYTMSISATNIPENGIPYLYFKVYNKETSANNWIGVSANSKTKVVTINKTKYDYIDFFIQINPNTETFENMVITPMLALGSYTELPFEAYKPPITTYRGIGDYKDRIYTKDGKVWFEQNIRNKIVNKFLSSVSAHSTIEAFTSSKTIPKIVSSTYPYVSNKNQISNIGAYEVDFNKTGELHWYMAKNGSYLIPPDKETWTNATDAYEYFMSVTGNIPMEYQYVLATPIITEITGSLAEKILAIDKSKNITIYSDNGVYGNTEVVEE